MRAHEGIVAAVENTAIFFRAYGSLIDRETPASTGCRRGDVTSPSTAVLSGALGIHRPIRDL